MNDNLTPVLTMNSIESVRREIAKKQSPYPYFANGKTIENTITDYDTWPYPRWYRGVSYYPDPIVAEREAGFRPRRDACYKVVREEVVDERPNLCFEAACSTIFPCYPEISSKMSDKVNLNNLTNRVCLVQYR